MKQTAIVSILCAVTLIGCGHKEAVVVGPDGSSATVTQDNGGDKTTINVTGKDGEKVSETISKDGVTMSDSKGESMTMSAGAVTEKDLGLPFYPGSSESKTGMSMITKTQDDTAVVCTRTTKDDPSKVVDFYKDKITDGKPVSMSGGGITSASVSGKLNGNDVSVSATNDGKSDTVVMVSVGSKKSH